MNTGFVFVNVGCAHFTKQMTNCLLLPAANKCVPSLQSSKIV